MNKKNQDDYFFAIDTSTKYNYVVLINKNKLKQKITKNIRYNAFYPTIDNKILTTYESENKKFDRFIVLYDKNNLPVKELNDGDILYSYFEDKFEITSDSNGNFMAVYILSEDELKNIMEGEILYDNQIN